MGYVGIHKIIFSTTIEYQQVKKMNDAGLNFVFI